MPLRDLLEKLSSRERQVCDLAAIGKTDREIAEVLGISMGSLFTYWTRIRSKLGISRRAELASKLTQTVLCAQPTEHDKLDSPSTQAALESMELIPEAVLAFNTDGFVMAANQLAATLLCNTEQSLLGLHVSRFVPSELVEGHVLLVDTYLQDPHRMVLGHEGTVEVVTLSGHRRRCRVSINSSKSESGDIVFAILSPVSQAH